MRVRKHHNFILENSSTAWKVVKDMEYLRLVYSCLSGPRFQSEWNIKYDPNPPCQLASPQQSLGVPTAFAINFADVTLFWPEPLRLNSDSGPYMNQMRYNCRFSHRWCYLYCGRTETPSRIPNHTTVGGNPFIDTVLVLYLCPWFCLLRDISIDSC